MLFLMAISLYTSRVILNALGVEDFGIYNVVGGFVVMFSMISNSLSSAISRFITYEIGKGNLESLKNIFSSSVTIQFLLSIIIFIIAELCGFWFINAKMNIPVEKVYAANWVLQFSILTFITNLISVPYNAVIIAHEKMSAFAYISIIEAVGKLSIAYLVVISPFNRLIFYSILMCLVAIIVRVIYGYYCRKHFLECKYTFIWNKKLLSNIFSFAGWSFIGAAAGVLRDQGVNLVINVFCGPAVNAARGIAVQVNTAINSFTQNFMTALNPQITKSCAAGNYDYMLDLVYKGSRISFYLLLILALPIIMNADFILKLWLQNVPEYAISFVRLILVLALCDSVTYSLVTAMLATGRIKRYQIIVGSLNLLNLPFSYVALYFNFSPISTLYIAIGISLICLIARLILLKSMLHLSIKYYCKSVIFNVLMISMIAFPMAFFIKSLFVLNTFNNLLLILADLLIAFSCITYIGLKKAERDKAKEIIKKRLKKYILH
ncbi:lipopolysaccharide biosynthesis protein [uncultured Bacteroides sp.]|uniref:lipopolysaccharide biosynthesis protein n=1 Tax=uncultured Bacteroides sp. TaxID=162156 RepID=UPI00345CA55D